MGRCAQGQPRQQNDLAAHGDDGQMLAQPSRLGTHIQLRRNSTEADTIKAAAARKATTESDGRVLGSAKARQPKPWQRLAAMHTGEHSHVRHQDNATQQCTWWRVLSTCVCMPANTGVAERKAKIADPSVA